MIRRRSRAISVAPRFNIPRSQQRRRNITKSVAPTKYHEVSSADQVSSEHTSRSEQQLSLELQPLNFSTTTPTKVRRLRQHSIAAERRNSFSHYTCCCAYHRINPSDSSHGHDLLSQAILENRFRLLNLYIRNFRLRKIDVVLLRLLLPFCRKDWRIDRKTYLSHSGTR